MMSKKEIRFAGFFLVSVFAFALYSCGSAKDETNGQSDKQDAKELISESDELEPSFEFTEHDFGEIAYGEVVGARFRFENKGDGPLVIERVGTSCGCTVAEHTEKPVAPGESGFVEVVFDSRGKNGAQFQDARVYFKGLNKPFRLQIVAQVVKK